jgi:hypothetical protein
MNFVSYVTLKSGKPIPKPTKCYKALLIRIPQFVNITHRISSHVTDASLNC